MSYRDSVISPSRIITIRYRDKYVDLVSDSEHYGMMTQSADGSCIEFDFSQCRVIGTRDVWPMPVVVDPNAPKDGIVTTREQLQLAASKISCPRCFELRYLDGACGHCGYRAGEVRTFTTKGPIE